MASAFFRKLRLTLEMIKFEHSVFALPFALTAAILAYRADAFATPRLGEKFLWIIVAMVGARSAAMAFNLSPPNSDGQAPPQTVLQLLPQGGIQMPLLQQPTGSTVDLVIDSSGNVSPQNSSARFKEDIRPLQDDFHKVLLLEPRSFSYKETGARGIGYTAEEVAET